MPSILTESNIEVISFPDAIAKNCDKEALESLRNALEPIFTSVLKYPPKESVEIEKPILTDDGISIHPALIEYVENITAVLRGEATNICGCKAIKTERVDAIN